MELKIEIGGDLLLWIGPNGLVQVPMDKKERAACRHALLDAIELLDQTIVKWSTFSTAVETDAVAIRNSLRPDGCLAVFDCSPPSERPADSRAKGLRLVSSRPLDE